MLLHASGPPGLFVSPRDPGVRRPHRSSTHRLAVCAPRRLRSSAVASADLITREELEREANSRGLALKLSTFGPFFRATCVLDRGDSDATSAAALPESADAGRDVVGSSSGFVFPPLGLLHVDQMRIYNSKLRGTETTRTVYGAGLLLGVYIFRHAYDQGCRKAEILAIKDEDRWHRRLVNYYTRIGFHPVREVGENGLRDLPDLLVWGGAGTRMNADVVQFLDKWSNALRS